MAMSMGGDGLETVEAEACVVVGSNRVDFGLSFPSSKIT